MSTIFETEATVTGVSKKYSSKDYDLDLELPVVATDGDEEYVEDQVLHFTIKGDVAASFGAKIGQKVKIVMEEV